MDFNHLLVGGAAIGFVTAFWAKIKVIAWKICNLLVQQVEIHDQTTTDAVIGYLINNYPRSKMYDKTYGGIQEYIRDNKRTGHVGYEVFGRRSIIFWNGWIPFYCGGPDAPKNDTNGNSNNNNNNKNSSSVCGSITHIRGFLKVDDIIKTALEERNKILWDYEADNTTRRKRFFIRHVPDIAKDASSPSSKSSSFWFQLSQYRLLGYTQEQLGLGKADGVSLLENLIFPNRVKLLIEEIKLWHKNKEWYNKRSIPWKRGWLLYGPPGTGKTALARAFAEDLDLPIFVFNLAEIGNFEFMRQWINMQASAPCIALIEDIDNVFNGRENIANGGRNMFTRMLRESKSSKSNPDAKEEQQQGGILNFDVFLNCLDGVERSEGIFTIITTNDLSKIDSALGQPRVAQDGSVEFISTRPGRIDKAIELTYMEPREKRIMAERILREYPEALSEMLEYIETTLEYKETPAQFQERCAQIALAKFWREQHPELFQEDNTVIDLNFSTRSKLKIEELEEKVA